MTEAEVFMTQAELAERWRLSQRTLERWRAERYGPRWLVIGGSIRYRLADITAYEDRVLRGGKS